jgi:hypothetical protein
LPISPGRHSSLTDGLLDPNTPSEVRVGLDLPCLPLPAPTPSIAEVRILITELKKEKKKEEVSLPYRKGKVRKEGNKKEREEERENKICVGPGSPYTGQQSQSVLASAPQEEPNGRAAGTAGLEKQPGVAQHKGHGVPLPPNLERKEVVQLPICLV